MTSTEGAGRGPSGTAKQRVTLLCAPAPIGGLESAVAALAGGLAREGVAVQLIQLLTPTGVPPAAFADLETLDVRLDTVRSPARAYRTEARLVRRLVMEHGSRVLHSHGERADLIARLLGAAAPPRVSTVHGFVVNSRRARLAKWAHLRVLRGMSRVIGVSDTLARELEPRLEDRVITVPNSIAERPLLSRTEARARLGLPDDVTLVGWVGRFSDEKRPLLFLEAFAALEGHDGVHAVLIGDGPLLDAARVHARTLGVAERVHLPGALPDAGALFRAFDLFVLSSGTEGTPITLLEAMHARVPAVATAVGGVPAMLRDGAGWLVPPGDASALAAAMDDALQDPARRSLCAARSAEVLRDRFSEAAWIDRHIRLYIELALPLPDGLPVPSLEP